MSSKRLPKKTLATINNKSLLKRILERVKLIKKINKIIISTSRLKEDNPIENFAKKNNVELYRGNLNNVLKRAILTAKVYDLDYIIRICGDRPFVDYDLHNEILKKIKYKNFDLITNNLYKEAPKGLTLEIISLKALNKIFNNSPKKKDFEHITNYIYENRDKFKIRNYVTKTYQILNKKKTSLNLDTIHDLKKIRDLVKKLGLKDNPKTKIEEILKYA